jgi:hypothetical protein
MSPTPPFKLTPQDPPEPKPGKLSPKETHLPKPGRFRWLNGERRTWWYKETIHGVVTGCPCCGREGAGYGRMNHAKGCPRGKEQ